MAEVWPASDHPEGEPDAALYDRTCCCDDCLCSTYGNSVGRL